MFLLVLTICLTTVGGRVSDVSTLKFIYVIARHGSRAPVMSYPFDPYPVNDTRYWPEGAGQLTALGKIQAYTVGVNLRRRYNEFLGSAYRPSETRLLSNLHGRDLASAELLAAGLFPPVDEEVWNQSLLWQPIPIWPETFDVYDLLQTGVCPRLDSFVEKAYEKGYDEIFLPKKDFIAHLQNVTGETINLTSVHDLEFILFFWDLLRAEEEQGLRLPDWATKDFRDNLNDLYQKQYKLHSSYYPEIVQLTAGPVLTKVVSDFQNPSRGKITLLMSHDNTIYQVAQAFGLSNFPLPQMAAYMILEVHDGVDYNLSEIIQMVYYKNGTSEEPIVFDMPNCRQPCSVQEFAKKVKAFSLGDCEEVCGLRKSSGRATSTLISAVYLLVMILSVINCS